MEAIVGGAALGAVFDVLYDLVKVALGKTTEFKPLLRALKSTLDSLQPQIIQEIAMHNLALDLRNDHMEALERKLVEGKDLVDELLHARMQWNYCLKPCYADRIVDLDDSLKMLLKTLELQQARDVKETLRLARSIRRHTAATLRSPSPPPTPPPPPPPTTTPPSPPPTAPRQDFSTERDTIEMMPMQVISVPAELPQPAPPQFFSAEMNTIQMAPRQVVLAPLELPQPAPPRFAYVERYVIETIPRQVVSARNTATVPKRERNKAVKVVTEGAAAVGEILDVIMEVRNKTLMAKSLVGDIKSTTSWISKRCKGSYPLIIPQGSVSSGDEEF